MKFLRRPQVYRAYVTVYIINISYSEKLFQILKSSQSYFDKKYLVLFKFRSID